jgi:hypothetical protein
MTGSRDMKNTDQSATIGNDTKMFLKKQTVTQKFLNLRDDHEAKVLENKLSSKMMDEICSTRRINEKLITNFGRKS